MNHALSYFTTWLTNNGYTIDDGGTVVGHVNGRNPKALSESVWLAYLEHRDALPAETRKRYRLISIKEFEIAIRDYLASLQDARTLRVYENVSQPKGAPSDLSQLERFVLGLTGSCDPVIVGVLAHFLSNVKRKMLGESVDHHLMPVLTGPQGTGKTIAVKQLCGPLMTRFATASIDVALDRSAFPMFEKYFIVFFDEMAGLDRADASILKKLVSGDDVLGRVLYTNGVMKVQNRVSFLGTSNHSVATLSNDPTGARRFFEIRIPGPTLRDIIGYPTAPPLEGVTVDYQKLWRGISEERNAYWPAIEARVVEHQKGLVGADAVNDFVDEHALQVGPGEETATVLYSSLFRIFQDWVKEANYSHFINKRNFANKLKSYGIEVQRLSHRDGPRIRKETVCLINAAHSLSLEGLISEKTLLEKLRPKTAG